MQDRRLASHVLNVHKLGKAPAAENGQELLTPELLRAYIATAKTFQPYCPRELTGTRKISHMSAEDFKNLEGWLQTLVVSKSWVYRLIV